MNESNSVILSVITVTYNSVNDIEKTIASVCRFVSFDVEYIVVDGGSTDGTTEIIRKYEDRISCWISEKDNGIYDAMNKGIQLAHGVWCLFINSGDALLYIPKTLYDETFYSYSAIAAAVETDRDGVIRPGFDWKLKLHNTLPHQGLFYNIRKKRIIFNTDFRIFADYDLNLRMYMGGERIFIIDDVVAFHSLVGISNSKVARNEAFLALKNNCGFISVILSWVYKHYQGIKKRMRNV